MSYSSLAVSALAMLDHSITTATLSPSLDSLQSCFGALVDVCVAKQTDLKSVKGELEEEIRHWSTEEREHLRAHGFEGLDTHPDVTARSIRRAERVQTLTSSLTEISYDQLEAHWKSQPMSITTPRIQALLDPYLTYLVEDYDLLDDLLDNAQDGVEAPFRSEDEVEQFLDAMDRAGNDMQFAIANRSYIDAKHTALHRWMDKSAQSLVLEERPTTTTQEESTTPYEQEQRNQRWDALRREAIRVGGNTKARATPLSTNPVVVSSTRTRSRSRTGRRATPSSESFSSTSSSLPLPQGGANTRRDRLSWRLWTQFTLPVALTTLMLLSATQTIEFPQLARDLQLVGCSLASALTFMSAMREHKLKPLQEVAPHFAADTATLLVTAIVPTVYSLVDQWGASGSSLSAIPEYSLGSLFRDTSLNIQYLAGYGSASDSRYQDIPPSIMDREVKRVQEEANQILHPSVRSNTTTKNEEGQENKAFGGAISLSNAPFGSEAGSAFNYDIRAPSDIAAEDKLLRLFQYAALYVESAEQENKQVLVATQARDPLGGRYYEFSNVLTAIEIWKTNTTTNLDMAQALLKTLRIPAYRLFSNEVLTNELYTGMAQLLQNAKTTLPSSRLDALLAPPPPFAPSQNRTRYLQDVLKYPVTQAASFRAPTSAASPATKKLSQTMAATAQSLLARELKEFSTSTLVQIDEVQVKAFHVACLSMIGETDATFPSTLWSFLESVHETASRDPYDPKTPPSLDSMYPIPTAVSSPTQLLQLLGTYLHGRAEVRSAAQNILARQVWILASKKNRMYWKSNGILTRYGLYALSGYTQKVGGGDGDGGNDVVAKRWTSQFVACFHLLSADFLLDVDPVLRIPSPMVQDLLTKTARTVLSRPADAIRETIQLQRQTYNYHYLFETSFIAYMKLAIQMLFLRILPMQIARKLFTLCIGYWLKRVEQTRQAMGAGTPVAQGLLTYHNLILTARSMVRWMESNGLDADDLESNAKLFRFLMLCLQCTNVSANAIRLTTAIALKVTSSHTLLGTLDKFHTLWQTGYAMCMSFFKGTVDSGGSSQSYLATLLNPALVFGTTLAFKAATGIKNRYYPYFREWYPSLAKAIELKWVYVQRQSRLPAIGTPKDTAALHRWDLIGWVVRATMEAFRDLYGIRGAILVCQLYFFMNLNQIFSHNLFTGLASHEKTAAGFDTMKEQSVSTEIARNVQNVGHFTQNNEAFSAILKAMGELNTTPGGAAYMRFLMFDTILSFLDIRIDVTSVVAKKEGKK